MKINHIIRSQKINKYKDFNDQEYLKEVVEIKLPELTAKVLYLSELLKNSSESLPKEIEAILKEIKDR